ncbi:MAG: DNA helicase PcrA [Firmicutes bacterium]|jgi:DNA helicase-2/ATP-dependent DNA helicase PcrA|nr:DNA helicase PcrA [Bacillota bacterium]
MDLSFLNKMQYQGVINTEGPSLILAGAGSGKTRVLTHKIAYLIEEKKVFPSKVLAFTFTNKAAKEMRSRIQGLIGEKADGLWMGTFHSICVRILRRDIDKIGYGRDFVIYDTSDQKTLIKDCLKELNIDDKSTPVNFVQYNISSAKNEMLTPEKYDSLYGGDFKLKAVAKVYELYQDKLQANNAMDFDDLILNTIHLLSKHEDVIEYYHNRFNYVLVDEYQDTNRAQYVLIRLLTGNNNNLCVVGDIDQSIYGWRGADIRNIRDFEKDYPSAKVILLEQNYRSSKNILDAANAVIKNNKRRKEKKLWTDMEGGNLIKYYNAQSERDEASYVVSQIEKEMAKERKYEDFAVLYRTNAQSRIFEEYLIKERIPYKIVGGHKFYDRMEIKDMMAYLKVIQNPLDEVNLLRIINVPKRGIGAKTVQNFRDLAEELDCDLFNAILYAEQNMKLSAKVKKGLAEFISLLMKHINNEDLLNVSEILLDVMKTTGYVEQLKLENTIESRSRIENLKELSSVTDEFIKRSETGNLEDFLAETSLMSDIDNMEDEDESITLMTLHSAKGLEFPVVFLVGMEEGIFPSSRSMESDDDIEEERRLCYVGITRAEDQLYISHATMRNMYGRTNVNLISRFIEEIPKNLIESDSGTVAKRERKKVQFTGFGINKPKGNMEKISGDNVKPGTKVFHDAFGQGTIISKKGNGDDSELTIAFDNKGIKKLILGYAPLKVIS